MIRAPAQLDLLDWTPPAATVRYAPERVRAATIGHLISRAVAETLRDCGKDRAEIAQAMGDYLGKPVSVAMLDAYASPAREDHAISLARFVALLKATNDRRLLQLLADQMGLAVVTKADLARIELAHIDEKQDELDKRKKFLRAAARAGEA